MADQDQNTPTNTDDDWAAGDEVTQLLQKGIEEIEKAEADKESEEFGYDQPLDESDARDTVSAEEGQKMASDAQIGVSDAKDPPADPDPKSDTAKKADDAAKQDPSADETKAGTDAAAAADKGSNAAETGNANSDADKASEQVDLTSASIADLVKDIPEVQQAEIVRRLGEQQELYAVFDSHKDEIARHGQTPKDVMTTLLNVNDMATTKPSEYLAWYGEQMGFDADKTREALAGLAERHGLKVLTAKEHADLSGDDPFETEEQRTIREQQAEIQRLRAGDNGAGAQPGNNTVSPEEYSNALITGMANELNPDGTVKRPHFNDDLPIFAEAMKAFVAQQKALPTRDEAAKIYDSVLAAQAKRFGAPANPAADPADNPINQEAQQKTAAAAEKAKRASTSIDSSGQGASRHLASLPEGATTEETVAAAYAAQMANS